MKKIFLSFTIVVSILTAAQASDMKNTETDARIEIMTDVKYDIKIKNDSGDEVTVINAGSGGTYRLTKNATTVIKMEEGDKLFIYEGGKKGRLLLTAASDMDGKVQLFSKL